MLQRLFNLLDDICFLTDMRNTLFLHEISNINPSRPNPGGREKIKSNFYFHTSSEAPERRSKIKI